LNRARVICGNRAAPPPPPFCPRRRLHFFCLGAPPPPPIISRRAADLRSEVYFLPLIVVRQSSAVMLATANYFCNFLADVFLFTRKMRKADMIDNF